MSWREREDQHPCGNNDTVEPVTPTGAPSPPHIGSSTLATSGYGIAQLPEGGMWRVQQMRGNSGTCPSPCPAPLYGGSYQGPRSTNPQPGNSIYNSSGPLPDTNQRFHNASLYNHNPLYGSNPNHHSPNHSYVSPVSQAIPQPTANGPWSSSRSPNLSNGGGSSNSGYPSPQTPQRFLHPQQQQQQSYPAGSGYFYGRGITQKRNPPPQLSISTPQRNPNSYTNSTDNDAPLTPLLSLSIAQQELQAARQPTIRVGSAPASQSPPPPPQQQLVHPVVSQSSRGGVHSAGGSGPPPPPPPEALVARVPSGRRSNNARQDSDTFSSHPRQLSQYHQQWLGAAASSAATYLHVPSSTAALSVRSRVTSSSALAPGASVAPSIVNSITPTNRSRFTTSTAVASNVNTATTVQRVAAAINHNFAAHSRRQNSLPVNELVGVVRGEEDAADAVRREGEDDGAVSEANSDYLVDDFLLDNPYFGLTRNPTMEVGGAPEEGLTIVVDDTTDDPFQDPLLHADAYSAAIQEEQRALECNIVCGRVVRSNEWRPQCPNSGGCPRACPTYVERTALPVPLASPQTSRNPSPQPEPEPAPVVVQPQLPKAPLWPGGRFGHTAVSNGDHMIIFGGRNCETMLGDTWQYDRKLGTWACLSDNTNCRAQAAAAAAVANNNIAAIGTSSSNVNLSVSTGVQQLPWPRAGHSAIDSLRGSMIVFGGSVTESECACDCWEMNFATSEWKVRTNRQTYSYSVPNSATATPGYGYSNRSPSTGPRSPPPPLQHSPGQGQVPSACMLYPKARKGHTATLMGNRHMVILGGCTPGNAAECENSKVWALDLNTNIWKAHLPVGDAPCPRTYHVSAAAPGRLAVFVFGGISTGCETQQYFNDLFELTFRCKGPMNERGPPIWRRLDTSGPIPSPRMCSSLVMRGHTMYIVSGCAEEVLDESDSHYELDTQTLTWRRLSFITGHPSCSRPTTVLCNNTLVSFGGALSSMGCYSNRVYTMELEVPTLKDLCREWLRLKNSRIEAAEGTVPVHLNVFLSPTAGRRQPTEDW